MQPIQLSLKPNPETTRLDHCSAFALIFSENELKTPDALVDALANLYSQRAFQQGQTYLLPQGNNDVNARGLAWIADTTTQAISCPVGGIALKPLVCDDSGTVNIWIPQDSRLHASVDAEVLSEKLTLSTFVRVWLPSIGLVGLETHDQLRPADYLAAPTSTTGDSWKSPPDVWSLPQRMVEIGMLSPPSAQQLLDDIEQEIGKPEWSLFDSHPTGEIADKPGAISRLQRWLLAKLDKIAGRADKSSGNRSESEKLSDSHPPRGARLGGAGTGVLGKGLALAAGVVTAPMAAAMAKLLQSQRDKQIHKLLNMLHTNPDQALKFAIPIGAIGAAFRGFAIPGAALMARLTDFSLGGLGGAGGPADFWDINYQLQTQLQQKYREQANREIAAGRYRRAAYIYAHLLSDFRAAATTLEQGKYFNEAAVLYREKLHNKSDAARCLALGGQFQEASNLYVSINQFEQAGEVWLDAGNPENAKQMFQNAYEQQISKGAMLSAATILDQRLDRRNDGIDLLQRQWPAGADNVRCAEMAIRWLGEDGRHDGTKQFMSKVMEAARDYQMVDVAQITRNAANNYPDNQVRIAAEDLCRLAASRALNSGAPIQRSNVLSTLAILDKGDLQLRRDATGYGRRLNQLAKRSSTQRKATPLTLTHLKNLALPADAPYVDYIAEHGQLYALAAKGIRIFVVHMPDMESPHQLGRSVRATMLADTSDVSRSDAFMVSSKSIHVYGPVQDFVMLPPLMQDSPGLFIQPKDDVMAAIADGNWIWELCRFHDSFVLRDRSNTYDLIVPWVQAWEETGFFVDSADCQSFDICLSGRTPVMALDAHLFVLRQGGVVSLATVGGAIRSLASSMVHTVQRVAVAHRNGLDVVFTQTGSTIHVCKQRGYSLCQWAPNGRLLAWSDGCLHCFEIRSNTFIRAAEVKLPVGSEPVRLLRLSPDTIGVAYANGIIERYRLPR